MKKDSFSTIICVLLLVLIFFSCSKPPAKEGKKFIDEAGRTVIIPPRLDSIISLSPANTEILFAIGAGDNVVGVTDYCNYPPRVSGIPKVGGFADVNIEKIAELNPDLIFASHLHISKVLPALENLGFTVVVTNPVTVPGVFDSIEFVGKICARESETKILIDDLHTKFESFSALLRDKGKFTVYWELSEDLWTIGKNSYVDDLITKAGGQNIAAHLNAPWLQLSNEFILHANPHTIFLADHPYVINRDALKNRPGWNSLAAVQNNRIIEVTLEENDAVSRPGPRVIEALHYIAKNLHPEVFKDVDK
ncbi:MAG: ABC transporter substrate-binding protein [Spirochaetales bacterium]|nr:ABC transporter substrate-binding protein [Spirochaetales bacterium]